MTDTSCALLAHGFPAPPLLRTVALGCERDERTLFRQLYFSLGAGGMLHVKGPNGCGKTSLLRLLAGLAQPTQGRVERYPPPSPGASRPPLWIGHAPGIKNLLTPFENLSWLGTLHTPVSDACVRRALAAVGLRGTEDVPCHALSAGQQRRVALARLHLPGTPLLWILDEPYTALDQQGINDLEHHLARHCAHGGAVVLTSHHKILLRASEYRELDLGQCLP
ncbi:cytochrome c biogenesis heme-transporting ATPase CcmA [Bordetella petrii]|uniref:cytochrome c biogenesis heme-transporting ATPase CcmA n=1 Tax=Bordetella petrii TaxID=94624 RepID=UPI001E61B61B|nr:cytochrome c biogenesis heme-transporting ATPase CcmA [Bordetella petrii]MCD0501403.1 cytochrome c biogenesis heme-transporting ATPase CcmA [Bordetella petrii]